MSDTTACEVLLTIADLMPKRCRRKVAAMKLRAQLIRQILNATIDPSKALLWVLNSWRQYSPPDPSEPTTANDWNAGSKAGPKQYQELRPAVSQ